MEREAVHCLQEGTDIDKLASTLTIPLALLHPKKSHFAEQTVFVYYRVVDLIAPVFSPQLLSGPVKVINSGHHG